MQATCPVLPAAVGLAVGALLARDMSWIPIGPLVLVAGLCFAVRRLPATVVGWLAVGLVHAGASWVLPSREPNAVDPARPVSALVELAGPWRENEAGWSARCRVLSSRQQQATDLVEREAWIYLPGDAPPPAAQRLHVRGRLRWRLVPRNGVSSRAPPTLTLTVKSRQLVEEVGESAPSRWRAAGRQARERIGRALPDAAHGGSTGSSLGGALLLGDSSRLEPGLQATLRAVGLAHLTAVSGLHLALVASLAVGLSTALGGRAKAPLMLLTAAGYFALVGGRPSLVRSLFMLVAALAAVAVKRPPSASNALAIAAAGLLAITPSLIENLGFVLSMTATSGLLWATPRLAESMPRSSRSPPTPRWLAKALAASLGAQLFSLPWTASVFSVLQPAAPVLNLLYVPWTAVMLATSVLIGMVAVVEPSAAAPLTSILDLLAVPYRLLERIPPSLITTLPWATGWLGATALATTVWAALRLPWRSRLAGLGLLTLAVLVQGRWAGRPDAEVRVIDVGQGDAILLQSRGRNVLVDGGGWRHGDIAGRVLLPALARAGVRRIDLMVMTHSDQDHCAGLLGLSRYLAVRELWVGDGWQDGPCGRQLVSRLSERTRTVGAPTRASVGGWNLQVLWPAGVREGIAPSSANRGSLVILASHRERRLLLTGDVDDSVERALVAGGIGRVDWLKVAHHGSRTSTSAALLEVIRPRAAIVSAGRDNPYGHPSAEVVARLARSRVPLLRTDLDGGIELRIQTATGVFETSQARHGGPPLIAGDR